MQAQGQYSADQAITTENRFIREALDNSPSKDGGSIRASGAKFTAHPVTGTGSLTFPVFTSPRPLTSKTIKNWKQQLFAARLKKL